MFKRIEYSYPTSPNAEQLGFTKQGCYIIHENASDDLFCEPGPVLFVISGISPELAWSAYDALDLAASKYNVRRTTV